MIRGSLVRRTTRSLVKQHSRPIKPTNTHKDDAAIGFSRHISEKDKRSLRGSVDSFSRHIFICDRPGSSTQWPARVEATSSDYSRGDLISSVVRGLQDLSKSVKVTVCDAGDQSASGDGVDVIDFRPGQPPIRIKDVSDLQQLLEYFKYGEVGNLKIENLNDNELFVFICGHKARDERCGFCGPRLADAFLQEINKRKSKFKFVVAQTSHIGGHKYAANVVVMPQAAWYGFVTPNDVPELLDAAEDGKLVDRLLRGVAWPS